MHVSLRRLLLGAVFALGFLGSALAQQDGAAKDDAAAKAQPPANFVAPADPKSNDSNAERAKSQPGNNAPFWRAVRKSGEQQGVTSLPGAEEGTLIQRFTRYPGSRFTTAGEAWREVRNRWLIPYGGSLIIITLGGLALLYWRKGAIGHEHESGRKVERFTPFERSAHWSNAIAFVILAISGLTMAFGKFILLPILGSSLFGWLTYGLKTLHNVVGPLFVVSLVIIIVTFVRDEMPRKGDWAWLRNAGGVFSGVEVPSHRFNAGEKVIYWAGAVVLGFIAIGSGLVLDKILPGLDYNRAQMQLAHMVHATATMLMMAMLLVHIYLGTIGMKGAYRVMRTGYADEGWAHEHHALWLEDIKAGKIPAQRSGTKSAPEPVVAQPRAQT
jgi:formate dehydrogenase subunit gamma